MTRTEPITRRTVPQLVVTPPNVRVGMLERHQLDRMREVARRAVREALESAPAEVLG